LSVAYVGRCRANDDAALCRLAWRVDSDEDVPRGSLVTDRVEAEAEQGACPCRFDTQRLPRVGRVEAGQAGDFDGRHCPQRAFNVVEVEGVELLSTEACALVATQDHVDERLGEVREVVVRCAGRDERAGLRFDLAEPVERAWRHRQHRARIGAETVTEHGVVPRQHARSP
jgi:hypothetical protein